MIPLTPATRIYLAAGATDLRKSFEGLSDLVTQYSIQRRPSQRAPLRFCQPQEEPDQVALFDGSGTWVCAKRLGEGCFAWPKTDEPGALRILAEEPTLLLSGIDLEKNLHPALAAQSRLSE